MVPVEPVRAIARAGPVDGADLGDSGTEQYEVVMADGSRHRYLATSDRSATTNGEMTRYYDWSGRI